MTRSITRYVLIFGLSTGIGLGASTLRADDSNHSWDFSDTQLIANTQDHSSQNSDVSAREAWQLWEEGGAIFVDARSPFQYKKFHIEGAELLPLHEYQSYIGDFEARYPKSTTLVVYCNSSSCPMSHKLAQRLRRDGFSDVRVFVGGVESWKALK